MDFEKAHELGYYFDRCIDLEFYDSNKNFMAALRTPKRGMKPSITVKGELIEGSYAISSYISIQNMSYDVNVNAVAYIKCRMYYSGISEAISETYTMQKMKKGHTILFTVLYADQEKEPPNRAVRFQCTTAAFDYTRSSQEIFLDFGMDQASKKFVPLISYNIPTPSKYAEIPRTQKECLLIDFLQAIAEAYNKFLAEEKKDGTTRKLNLENELRITAIKYPAELSESKIVIDNGIVTFGSVLKDLNNLKVFFDEEYGSQYKFYIYGGVMFVTKFAPPNWREYAGQTVKSESELNDYYRSHYLQVKTLVRYVDMYGMSGMDADDYSEYDTIPLNYVKSAYRNEVVIHATTIFDDRIFPGCHCKIKGNAIMGKQQGRKTSRIVNYTNETVIFRVTGGIEYEFSTTEDSYMSLVGPVIREVRDIPNINRGAS